MIARLRSHLGADDGFSLVELLAAMMIGGVVLTATMSVFIQGVKGTTGILNRVDNTQRARYAMDRVVRLLDAQVCAVLTANSDVQTPPIIAGSSSNAVTFYGDLSGASGTPHRYTITYVPKSGTVPGKITIDDYTQNATTKVWSKVGATNTLVTDITQAKNDAGVDQPVFSYYPYTPASSTDPNAGGVVSTTAATAPLTDAVAATIVKVGVKFAAVSSISHRDDTTRAYVSGSGSLATFNADPTTPSACS